MICNQTLCLEMIALLCFSWDCESLDQPVCWFRPTQNRWIVLDSSGRAWQNIACEILAVTGR